MLCRRQQKKTFLMLFYSESIIQNVLSICPNKIILFIKAIQQIHTKVKRLFHNKTTFDNGANFIHSVLRKFQPRNGSFWSLE
jgi:hypothetical protein